MSCFLISLQTTLFFSCFPQTILIIILLTWKLVAHLRWQKIFLMFVILVVVLISPWLVMRKVFGECNTEIPFSYFISVHLSQVWKTVICVLCFRVFFAVFIGSILFAIRSLVLLLPLQTLLPWELYCTSFSEEQVSKREKMEYCRFCRNL